MKFKILFCLTVIFSFWLLAKPVVAFEPFFVGEWGRGFVDIIIFESKTRREIKIKKKEEVAFACLLYKPPSQRNVEEYRMKSSA